MTDWTCKIEPMTSTTPSPPPPPPPPPPPASHFTSSLTPSHLNFGGPSYFSIPISSPSPSHPSPVPRSPAFLQINPRPVRTPSGTRRHLLTHLSFTGFSSSSQQSPSQLSISLLPSSPGKHPPPSPTSPTARSGSSPSKRSAHHALGHCSPMITSSSSSSPSSSSSSSSSPTVAITTAQSSSLLLSQSIQSQPTTFNIMSFTLNPTILARTEPTSSLSNFSTPPGSSNSTGTITHPYSRLQTPTSSHFKSVSAHQLIHWLQHNPRDLLVLDVRNVGAYRQAKIKDSVGFNLPTTLLKRPLYTVDRIEANLDSPADKARFARFRTALATPPDSNSLAQTHPADNNSVKLDDHPIKRIIILDGECSITALPNQHPLAFILRKFESAGFIGELNWLMGGFTALSRHPDAHSVLDFASESEAGMTSPPMAGQFGTMQASSQPDSLRMSLSMPPSLTSSPTNTMNFTSSPRRPPLPSGAKASKQRPTMALDMFKRTPAVLHDHDHDSLAHAHLTEAQNSTSTARSQLPPDRANTLGRARATANPFFNNIRQLNEHLSLDVSLQNLTPIKLPKLQNPSRDLPRLPVFFRRLLEETGEARARRLAHEFHDIEMAEQRRLQDVMRWHSSQRAEIRSSDAGAQGRTMTPVGGKGEGGVLDGALEHPFSISAGVELGYKNRYKNIWPWEHARIRLTGASEREGTTDYVNASLIQFELGDEKRVEPRRYIATQGPLASTFDDFWSLVCDQDVGLIVMLTKRHEAGREKCGDYLRSGRYGDIFVSIEAEEGNESAVVGTEEADDFFGFAASVAEETYMARTGGESAKTPKRVSGRALVTTTIRLSRVTRPELPARRIKHVQYRNWPDFDVPPAADELLDLVSVCRSHTTDVIRLNRSLQASHPSEDAKAVVGTGSGPVVVHCSAGVGRTGSFIAVDVMTEVLRAFYVEKGTGGDVEESLVRTKNGRRWMDISDSSPSSKKSSLPDFLESEHCETGSGIPPVLQAKPIMPLVNEMREQRMSMVANYRQYVFVYEVLLLYLLRELKIPIVKEDG